MANTRAPMKTVLGTVVSDKMAKTITVREERMVKHPLYGKYVRRASTYKAHDERSEAREGDTVEILRTRPLSKTKNWRLLRIVRRGRLGLAQDEASATAPAPSEVPEPAPQPEPVPEPVAEVEEAPAPRADEPEVTETPEPEMGEVEETKGEEGASA